MWLHYLMIIDPEIKILINNYENNDILTDIIEELFKFDKKCQEILRIIIEQVKWGQTAHFNNKTKYEQSYYFLNCLFLFIILW